MCEIKKERFGAGEGERESEREFKAFYSIRLINELYNTSIVYINGRLMDEPSQKCGQEKKNNYKFVFFINMINQQPTAVYILVEVTAPVHL